MWVLALPAGGVQGCALVYSRVLASAAVAAAAVAAVTGTLCTGS
jgi:hypothetical protein